MFFRTNPSSIRTRLLIRINALLIVSLLVVSTTIYFLLASSLRKADQNLILNLKETYSKLYEQGNVHLLEDRISPEILLVIKDKNQKTIFEKFPSHIDHDFEDESEINQIKEEVSRLPLKESWENVLLLSGEEEKDFLQKLEYQLRIIASREHWDTILPMIDNDNFEISITPMDNEKWMIIGKSSEEREEHLSKIRYISGIVIIPFIILGLIISLFLAENILRPVKNLAFTIREIRAGNSEARAKVRGTSDEIDELAEEFNSLNDHNRTLVKNIKDTVDNVAHDLRTPITRFRSTAEQALLRGNDPQVMRDALQDALEMSSDISVLLNAIMDVAESESKTFHLKKEIVDVGNLLNRISELYEHVAEEKLIEIHTTQVEGIKIEGDLHRLIQAFGNILDNGIKYSSENTNIFLSAEVTSGHVLIHITDEGPGIPESEQMKIWSRLYRGDASRSSPGLGIGLSLVKAIIEAHGGEIKLNSIVGQGSRFTVTLPTCNLPVI